jgi:hypothetical protein
MVKPKERTAQPKVPAVALSDESTRRALQEGEALDPH